MELFQDILHEIACTLPPGRPYVQFTYSQLAWRRFAPQGLALERRRRVLANLPPASVLRFLRSTEVPGPAWIASPSGRDAA